MASTTPADEDNYTFDPQLFRGSRFSQLSLARLTTRESIAPGIYKMDIYTNNKLTGTYDVNFKVVADGRIQPCLPLGTVRAVGINTDEKEYSDRACIFVSDLASGVTSHMQLSLLRLDLSVPQILLAAHPRGYIDPSDLDTGASLSFMNYIANYYNVSYSDQNARNQRSLWASMNAGVNLGSWQYRQLSNLTWDNRGSKWSNIRSYLQRPLPNMNSQLMLGQLLTRGRFFSGISYHGVSLTTDDRMLPDSMQGYAPKIRGIAATSARVSVVQNGTEIYQTAVSPGSFEINDLYPTSYSGDLMVTVTEANGAVSQFSVPFSAIPESMRPGVSRFNVEMGRTEDSGEHSLFGDLTWQRGMTNSVTFNSGVRVANGYQALMVGGVHGSALGAFGLDLTWSRASLTDVRAQNGWMAQLAWSKTYQPTATTISLAGYRYSSSGYFDLVDILGERQANRSHQPWESTTWNQQSRFDITLSQSLSEYGNLFLSGSMQNYRGGRSRDTQIQLGYSNSFRNWISMNLSVGRQRTGYNYDSGEMDTVTSLTFTFPLGDNGSRVPSPSSNWTHTTSGSDQYQSSLTGMLDEEQTINYSLNMMRDQQYHQTTFSGNMQKRFPQTTVGLNASHGKGYWQASGNVQGALVVHPGGVTFGPYVGETFALVEAKGAEGAKVFNSTQLIIDDSGYALVPAVTPYRYNRISLDPQGMEGDAELVDSEKEVAPVAGAAVKVVFRTRLGKALLIKSRLADGTTLPMGADVLDENNTVIGIAGQGGQIYLRTEQTKGHLFVRWGDGPQERCQLPFDISGKTADSPLIRLNEICQP